MEKVKSFQNLWPKILFYLLEDAIKPRMQHPSGQQKKNCPVHRKVCHHALHQGFIPLDLLRQAMDH